MVPPPPSFLARHEFLIRRLHSLSGLIPVGAYMVVHLVTNASVLGGPASFQSQVYAIHSLGPVLPLVEWVFIFIPIIFHAVVGVWIMRGLEPNTVAYPYGANWRYTMQRVTGMIAFVFIFWHVFHMHGWFHSEVWRTNVVEPYGGGLFRPYNAASSAGAALASLVVAGLYAVGVLACVFHLANGIWTMGITWGVWTSPAAQRRALWACGVFGVLLGFVGLSALGGMRAISSGEAHRDAKQIEDRMYRHRTESGELTPNEHKRSAPEPETKSASLEGNGQLAN